jgi:hypothetical protein
MSLVGALLGFLVGSSVERHNLWQQFPQCRLPTVISIVIYCNSYCELPQKDEQASFIAFFLLV